MLQVFSYGGGVQSTAALVLAAQRKLDYPTFLFANVGDDSEHPATLAYVRDVAMPYAAQHGIALHELRYTRRDGRQPTLYAEVVGNNRSIDIPMYLGSGKPGHRNCTKTFKIKVIDRWIKAAGATAEQPADVGLGISIDEFQRMRTPIDPRFPFRRRVYPLIDLRLARDDCRRIIASAGLPVPPKSACWFCPFHVERDWRALQRDHPDLAARAIDLEEKVNLKRAKLHRDAMYLAWQLIPLEKLLQAEQSEMDFDGDACESGYCMT